MMFDLQAPTDANYNKHNILCGTRSDLVSVIPTCTAANALPQGNAVGQIQAAIQACFNSLAAGGVPALQITSGEALMSVANAGSNCSK